MCSKTAASVDWTNVYVLTGYNLFIFFIQTIHMQESNQ